MYWHHSPSLNHWRCLMALRRCGPAHILVQAPCITELKDAPEINRHLLAVLLQGWGVGSLLQRLQLLDGSRDLAVSSSNAVDDELLILRRKTVLGSKVERNQRNGSDESWRCQCLPPKCNLNPTLQCRDQETQLNEVLNLLCRGSLALQHLGEDLAAVRQQREAGDVEREELELRVVRVVRLEVRRRLVADIARRLVRRRGRGRRRRKGHGARGCVGRNDGW